MRIPSRLKVRSKWVEVVYQKDFVCGKYLGEYCPNTRKITIAADQSPEKTMEIFLHELIHCLSDLYSLNITEKQIETIDGPLTRILLEMSKEF